MIAFLLVTGAALAGSTDPSCASGSGTFKQAKRALADVDADIRALPPNGDPGASTAALESLISGPCFRVLPVARPDLSPDSGLSLSTWWSDGGRAWVSQALELHDPGEEPVYGWVAPTVRTTLAHETRADHPLRSWLCSVLEPDCAPSAWHQRAETAYERFDGHKAYLDQLRRTEQGLCATEAAGDFRAWQACLEEMELPRTMLPLGGLQEVDDGWLVLAGRRGHYGYCDEVRVYDLSTGSAYVASNCGGLVLTGAGRVDGRRTRKGEVADRRAGRLPVHALREAAWATLMVAEAQARVRPYGTGIQVPPSVDVVVPTESTLSFRGQGLSFRSSSAQTSVSWAYLRAGEVVQHGVLRWPEDYNDAAADHAVKLLQLAEVQWHDACPTVPPPRLPEVATGGVSAVDADADVQAARIRDLARLVAEVEAPGCPLEGD